MYESISVYRKCMIETVMYMLEESIKSGLVGG